jgi:hypothetical protein
MRTFLQDRYAGGTAIRDGSLRSHAASGSPATFGLTGPRCGSACWTVLRESPPGARQVDVLSPASCTPRREAEPCKMRSLRICSSVHHLAHEEPLA